MTGEKLAIADSAMRVPKSKAMSFSLSFHMRTDRNWDSAQSSNTNIDIENIKMDDFVEIQGYLISLMKKKGYLE